ncbi:MAG: cysteine--tRNA ligase [Patescibacteria group bacterium]
MTLRLYNTMSRKIEDFVPIHEGKVGIYACGPTVYDYAHIGNLRSYITWDILHRTLKADGFKVKHVMNITDVGHLTGDGDEGDDKMEKGAAREKKTAWDIAKYYTKAFMANLNDLNIKEPEVVCRATDHIKEQINLIKKLERKGFTYTTLDGIYFDTKKLAGYGRLARLDKQELRAGARVAMGGKHHASDFALWKFSPVLAQRQMEWDSPWGKGFPGWHIECSAMSAKYLGIPFDIHTGGIDHIPVHHTNEIAQTEAAEGVIPAHYWMHNEFLNMGEDKMSKSLGNFVTIDTIKEKNVDPIAYRYFILQTHYRKQLSFSWEALTAAQSGLKHLCAIARELPKRASVSRHAVAEEEKIKDKFIAAINDDLDTPNAIALMWEAIKNKRISQKTLIAWDKILGLKIKECLEAKIPDSVHKLLTERDTARTAKDWKKSDELRDRLIKLGYTVMDTPDGTKVA